MSKTIKIGNRLVGEGQPCYIIAEAGINHNGDLSLAKQLVEAAARVGADAVKFQKRKLSDVYQQAILNDPRNGEQGLQYIVPILQEFELSDETFVELSNYCSQLGITFMCTPWDPSSADFLDHLGVPAFKIGSPDMTNLLLLEHVASKSKPLIVSTGMATEDEIRLTIAFLRKTGVPYILLHCVSAYPPSIEEINLRFIHALRDWSDWPVGFSSHDTGVVISTAAVAMGACVIERHITLDRNMRGPDHSSSLEPDMFALQVRQIRDLETALGTNHRWVSRGELLNRRVLAKSLVAACDIPEGAIIQREMVAAKSPGLGINPQRVNELVGRVAKRAIRRDEQFLESDLSARERAQLVRPIEIGAPWGIVARFNDLDSVLNRFSGRGPDLVEFHVSDRDLDAGISAFSAKRYNADISVHASEYCHDRLIDLCSEDEDTRWISIRRIQMTIDLARKLAPWFAKVGSKGPKVIVHVGGMSQSDGAYNVRAAYDRLADSLKRIQMDGVEFLLENLPPYPWFFGGRWFGYVLVDGESTAQLCAELGINLCFDTSHAVLECNRSKTSLIQYAQTVLPYTRHLHVSDGAGVGGEGLQIGDGEINFVELLPFLYSTGSVVVPEIWNGHHQNGLGFQLALERLSEIAWAVKALSSPAGRPRRPELQQLIVPRSASISMTLKVIDGNTVGTAFVLDEEGAMRGIVTDGDIRRALIRGVSLDSPISEIMNSDFVFAWTDTSSEEQQARLSGKVRILPILDRSHRLVDVASIYKA